VIDMQMGADDEIDCLRRESGRCELREERPVLLIELRDQRAIPRVSDACVNDYSKISGLDNEGLQGHQVLAVGSDEVGPEPRLGGNVGGRRLGEEVDGKAMTCSTTRVTRTSPTSHDILPTLPAT
jgi:hypothetical protein